MDTAPTDDLFAPTAVRDPHAFFRRLREIDPIHWSARHGVWILTGHAAVHDAFRDKELSSARAVAGFRRKLEARHQALLARALELLDGWMLLRDEPHHDRLRDPVRRAFTPAVAASLGERIVARVDRLIDGFGEEVEILGDFARPLTAGVICDLLGVDDDARDFLRGWTRDFGHIVYGAAPRKPSYVEAVARAGDTFHAHMRPLVERRRAEPRDDLLSRLVQSSEAEGWTTAELLGAASMLLFAGHDTTAAFITSATRALIEHPAALARWRDDPALAESAVEELLRFDGPSKTFVRVATRTHARGGHTIEEGDQMWLAILGANHDPSVFESPDELRLERAPNPHLAFGGGAHFCLGAALARTETRIALTRLFTRHPRLVIASSQLEWSPTLVDRSLLALPVRAVARAAAPLR